jgi:hypothetical protein
MRSDLTSPTYQKLIQKLLHDGFERVERDYRLLDVFPTETREKVVELWQLWPPQKNAAPVQIVRLLVSFNAKKIQHYSMPRREIEQALQDNELLLLETYRM